MHDPEKKVTMTVSIDLGTRELISKYARERAIGQLLTRLVRKHDYEMRYGPSKVETRLERIENRLLELLERDGQSISPQQLTENNL